MPRIITNPSSLDEIIKTKDMVDGFIIGIKDFCVNTNYKIEDFSLLNDLKDKDIFISLNKNMHDSDINKVKDILIELNNYNIKGIIYYDVGVLNIYNKLNLNYDLIWAQEHLVTNYNTINYWNQMGANYAFISNDITEEEIIDIVKNSKSKLLINLFGYLPMFVSKRHIVKNYLEYFKLNDNSKINYIEKEDKKYPIIDSNIGTEVYSNNILNGIKTFVNIDFDYVVLNSFNINLEDFTEIIDMFKNVDKSNVEKYYTKINSMFKNIDEGFLNTKTIYRVKKNDK